MKTKDVQIGQVYSVKVANNITTVKITAENPHGGWDGVHMATSKAVRIKSAQRLCGLAKPKPPTIAQVQTELQEPASNATCPAESNTAKRGGLNAAVRVLAEATEPLNCKTIVERILQQGYWSTNGKTPAATISAAILREIKVKGDNARFCKVGRGKFTVPSGQKPFSTAL
jgi:hypothetical protein